MTSFISSAREIISINNFKETFNTNRKLIESTVSYTVATALSGPVTGSMVLLNDLITKLAYTTFANSYRADQKLDKFNIKSLATSLATVVITFLFYTKVLSVTLPTFLTVIGVQSIANRIGIISSKAIAEKPLR